MKAILFVVAAILLIHCAFGSSPSAYVTNDAKNNLKSLVLAAQNKDGTFDSVKSASQFVDALTVLGETIPNKDKICAFAKKSLSRDASIESIYYAAKATEALGCGENVGSGVSDQITSILNNDKATVAELYFATSAGILLEKNKHLAFDESELLPVVSRLESLMESDGTFSNDGEGYGTLYHTGLGFATLAAIAKNAKIGSEEEFVIEVAAANADSILESGEDLDGLAFFDNDDSRTAFRVTNALLRGVTALKEQQDFDIDAETFPSAAEYFVQHISSVSTLDDAYNFLAGIDFFATNKINRPLVLTVIQGSLSLATKGTNNNVKVRVSDLWGKSVGAAKVFLVRASDYAKGDTTVVSNQELVASSTDSQEYEFNFLAAKPEQGFYSLEFSVKSPQGYSDISSTTRVFKVLTSVSVPSIDLTVVDSQDPDSAKTHTVNYGRKLGDDIRTNYYYTLIFSFNVRGQGSSKPVTVQQAFVRFFNPAKNIEAIFPARLGQKGYEARVDLKVAGKELLFTTGDYDVELFVGDSFVENPFSWNLGVLHISFPKNLHIEQKQNVYSDKSPIVHQFQKAQDRPHLQFSLAFTGLVLVPWVILLIGLVTTRANISNFPSSAGVGGLLFLGSIAATFTLYAFFWLELNMFQTLGILGGLSVVTLFSGNLALKSRAQFRQKQAKSD